MAYTLTGWIAAICMSVYWTAVVIKLIRLGRQLRKDPNAIPRELVGQLMRIVWYPIILILLAGLIGVAIPHIGALFHRFLGIWMEPLTGYEPPIIWQVVATMALAVAVACTALTFICWRKMGRSWRIGIDPGEKLDMICTGPYRYVRHPIYSLRMVINLCVMFAVPVPVVMMAAGIDSLLLQIEARREERYMESTHGQTYLAYKKNVGRFVPRWRVV